MSTSDPFILWHEVRRSKRYIPVLEWSELWLAALWPMALRIGVAPKGGGYDPEMVGNPPTVRRNEVDGYLPGDSMGSSTGFVIRVADPKTMEEDARRWGIPMLEHVRGVILHESQHAMDDLRGVDSGKHNIWFVRRLLHLRTVFPPAAL